jgi:branched-chain amino acid transport system ATP-binding protein
MTAPLSTVAAPSAALAVNNIQVVYGGVIEAVRDVSLQVRPGQIVALLGSNGAGKSTVLKAASGVLDAEDGAIEKGGIQLFGQAIEKSPAPQIVRQGMVQVPEGRRLFATLTVEENLIAGAHLREASQLAEARERVFKLFPRLADRRRQVAGDLSGGEQQMAGLNNFDTGVSTVSFSTGNHFASPPLVLMRSDIPGKTFKPAE